MDAAQGRGAGHVLCAAGYRPFWAITKHADIVDKPLSEIQLLSYCELMVEAGNETTRNAKIASLPVASQRKILGDNALRFYRIAPPSAAHAN